MLRLVSRKTDHVELQGILLGVEVCFLVKDRFLSCFCSVTRTNQDRDFIQVRSIENHSFLPCFDLQSFFSCGLCLLYCHYISSNVRQAREVRCLMYGNYLYSLLLSSSRLLFDLLLRANIRRALPFILVLLDIHQVTYRSLPSKARQQRIQASTRNGKVQQSLRCQNIHPLTAISQQGSAV